MTKENRWSQRNFYNMRSHNKIFASSQRRCSIKKGGILKNFTKFTGKHLCQSLYFNKVMAQVFPKEFGEILKNIFFTEHLRDVCF